MPAPADEDQEEEKEVVVTPDDLNELWLWKWLGVNGKFSYADKEMAMDLNAITDGELSRLLRGGGSMDDVQKMMSRYFSEENLRLFFS